MPLTVLIVDDEPLAREGLRMLLVDDPEITAVQEAKNGRDAVHKIREGRPDLVFLDVQMPEMAGFSVIHEIGAAQMPAVVFVTAHDQYAIRAFEIDALDYLLKPFDEERFQKTLARVKRHFQVGSVRELNERLSALLKRLDHTKPKQLERL